MAGLQGKVAVVTGASRGIGAATAKRLAADGARVVVNYASRADQAEVVAAEIRAAGGEAVVIQADLGALDGPEQLIRDAVAAFGAVDILVNNAAIFEGGSLDEVTADHFARTFEVNVRGPLLAAQEAARHMGEGGRIIHISSGLGSVPSPGASLYGASKAALESFTKSHAVELGPRGITVNTVSPGITETEMMRGSMPDDAVNALVENTPLKRVGKPEDVADVVAFVASDQSRWITGQVIAASGGLR